MKKTFILLIAISLYLTGKSQDFSWTKIAPVSDNAVNPYPESMPYECYFISYKDYEVYYGTTDNNKTPIEARKYTNDNRVVVLDKSHNLLKTFDYRLHNGKYRRFKGVPEITRSQNDSLLIITNAEILNPLAPQKAHKYKYYIDIIDPNLNKIWSDSLDPEALGNKYENIDEFKVELINNQIFIIASNDGTAVGNNAQLFVLKYIASNSYQELFSTGFDLTHVGWKYQFTKNKHLIICGANIAKTSERVNGFLSEWSIPPQAEKYMFFVNLNLSDNSTPVFKNYHIDNKFMANYPERQRNFNFYFSYPGDLLVGDNFVAISSEFHQYNYSSDIKGNSYMESRGINFVCFEMDGNINWIKSINKCTNTSANLNIFFMRSFLSGNDIVFFYYDNEKNVYREKFSEPFISYQHFCLVYGRIDKDGKLEKQILASEDEKKVSPTLSAFKQLDDHTIYMFGYGKGRKYKGKYYANFDVTK